MKKNGQFDIFLATSPGFESALFDEIRTKGFKQPKQVPGGVTITGGWPEVWRANLWIRGASRVLARLDQFKALNLNHLANLARKTEWSEVLSPDVPFRVEVTCAKSKIYHTDAAAERIATAITDTLGNICDDEATITFRARIDHDLCTLSVDTSGDLLHKRGYKEAVNQAPMRENMASLFLRQCGYDGNEPVLDPMCGSGTFVIEAAEIAARLNPGRSRKFAFEQFANFDDEAWAKMRSVKSRREPSVRFYGSDRDAGAIKISKANAERAGVSNFTVFEQKPISDIMAPEGPPGLVIINPPYGTRIGDRQKLLPLYSAMGQALRANFKGWRVGLITTEALLANATELPFLPTEAPVQHGGLRVTLYRTNPLQ